MYYCNRCYIGLIVPLEKFLEHRAKCAKEAPNLVSIEMVALMDLKKKWENIPGKEH
jgi:hypothetical protein